MYNKRKRLRLRNYDYSQNGYYFITICSQQKHNLFGSVIKASSLSDSDIMILNDAGKMVNNILLSSTVHCMTINLHEYVIMPNHLHFIIEIDNSQNNSPENICRFIQSFKRYTTIEYIKGVKSNKYPPFDRQIWQRNYYEHIIRTEKELHKIREYINNNPAKWAEDEYYNCHYDIQDFI